MQKQELRTLGFLLPDEDIRHKKMKQNYCLDICAGIHSPLAKAAQTLGIPTFCPIDADPDAGGMAHDLNNPWAFDFFIRLCWSGCIALAAASAPCSAYSKLRELPDGPRPLRTYDDLSVQILLHACIT